MRILAVSINGLLDLKNFLPVALEMLSKHSIQVDIVHFRQDLVNGYGPYDGLIVGSDWNENRALVQAFAAAGRKTILLQSEGMYLDENQWYIGKAPITDLACVWGPEHRDIFLKRGYNGRLVISGPPRFDLYNNFQPTLDRLQLYRKLSLHDVSRPYVLYLGQYFPQNEFGDSIYNTQVALTHFAKDTPPELYGLVKCHPQEAVGKYFSRSDIVKTAASGLVKTIDRGGHTEEIDISTLIYYAAAVVTYSSTAAVEAIILGRPAGIFESQASSPLRDGRLATLPSVKNASDIRNLINQSVDLGSCKTFIEKFFPGPLNGTFTSSTATAIASFMRDGTQHERVGVRMSEQANLSISPPSKSESESQQISNETYKQACIKAYSDLADILLANIEDFTVRDIEKYLEKPKVENRRVDSYYQTLHEKDQGYQTNNWLLPELPYIKSVGARTIVEVGCGNGKFIRAAAGVAENVIGVDFAKSPQLQDLPSNVSFFQADVTVDALPVGDLICSADVLEHFEPKDVFGVISKIHNSGPQQYHLIACYDDGHSHHTVTNPGVWLSMFRRLSPKYNVVDVRPRRNSVGQMVCAISNF